MKKVIVSLTLFFCSTAIFSQTIETQLVGVVGNDFQNSTLHISQSVGELVVSSSTNSPIVVTQGFQQTYPNNTSISKNNTLNYDVKAYPNPTSYALTLEFNSKSKEVLTIELLDINGKLLQPVENNITVNGTFKKEIDMSQLSNGNYVLRFINEKQESGTLKIIKN